MRFMRLQHARLALPALMLFAAACRDDMPTGPDVPAVVGPAFSISDAVHQAGVPQFYWLPPTVPNPGPAVTGTFDGQLLGAAGVYPQLEVRVCPAGASALCPASGAGSLASFKGYGTTPAITTDPAAGNYQLLWNKNDLPAGNTYRTWVLVQTASGATPLPLGYADVRVVATSKALKQVNPLQYVGLIASNPLYLKFTIRTGIAGAVSVALGTSTLAPGGTTTASATVTDLHGNALAGTVVAWAVTPSNSPPGTITPAATPSTTDASGTATATLTAGGSAGSGAVTATVGTFPAQLTGSANFTVTGAGGLAAGGNHTCGITSAGVPYCWGSNSWGELGIGSTSPVSVPNAVILPQGVSGFTQVAAGFTHTCGFALSNDVYCWGADDFYQLGYEDPKTDSPVPVAISDIQIAPSYTQLDAIGGHSCVRNSAAKVYCWGDIGGATFSGFASVAAGGLHQCGVTTSGGAMCWGMNTYGQLGDGTNDDSFLIPVPVAFPAGVTVASLDLGGWYSCAVTTAGAAYCWGNNSIGQLGNGQQPTGSKVPVPVSLPAGVTLTSITAGGVHACGLTTTGGAYCWGENLYGQLGDGTNIQSSTPVEVILPAGVDGFVALTAGSMHTCGIASTGAAYCWGKNDFGQLGNGTTTSSSTPQPVSGGLTFQTQ